MLYVTVACSPRSCFTGRRKLEFILSRWQKYLLMCLGTTAVEDRKDIRRKGHRGLVVCRQSSAVCMCPLSVNVTLGSYDSSWRISLSQSCCQMCRRGQRKLYVTQNGAGVSRSWRERSRETCWPICLCQTTGRECGQHSVTWLTSYSGEQNPGVPINLTFCKVRSTWRTKSATRAQADLAVQLAVLLTKHDDHGWEWWSVGYSDADRWRWSRETSRLRGRAP